MESGCTLKESFCFNRVTNYTIQLLNAERKGSQEISQPVRHLRQNDSKTKVRWCSNDKFPTVSQRHSLSRVCLKGSECLRGIKDKSRDKCLLNAAMKCAIDLEKAISCSHNHPPLQALCSTSLHTLPSPG